MKLRTLLYAALLAATPALHAQTVTTEVPADVVQRMDVLGPATVSQNLKTQQIIITLGGDPAPGPAPGPTPGPGPAPTPGPPPAPVATGKLFVTLVYDPYAETQAQAQARADLASQVEWAGLDVQFRSYAKDQQAIDDLRLRPALTPIDEQGVPRPVPLPCVIVQELKPGATSAPIIRTIPAALDKAAVVDAIKTLRGTK